MKHSLPFLMLVALVGCEGTSVIGRVDAADDVSATDASSTDDVVRDVVATDASAPDATPDASATDDIVSDVVATDASTLDATPDATTTDSPQADTATTDSGTDVPTDAAPDAPALSGPVAHYHFDGDFIDATGRNPTPCQRPVPSSNADNGATLGPDRYGAPMRAALFDGNRDFLDCGEAFSLVRTSWTFAAWENHAADTGSRWIFSKGIYSPNGIVIVGLAGGDYSFTTDFYANYFNAMTRAEPMVWHHWAVSYDLETGIRTIYRDGVLDSRGVGSDGAAARVGSTARLIIGGLWRGSSDRTGQDWWSGSIDEVRFYDRVLSDGEIRAIYTQENTRP